MLPVNLDMLASIRRQGMRPAAPVIIRLDDKVKRAPVFCDIPIDIDVGVPRDVPIDALELWPVCGLSVAIFAPGLSDRLRELVRAVVNTRPSFLTVITLETGFVCAWHPDRGWEKHCAQ